MGKLTRSRCCHDYVPGLIGDRTCGLDNVPSAFHDLYEIHRVLFLDMTSNKALVYYAGMCVADF